MKRTDPEDLSADTSPSKDIPDQVTRRQAMKRMALALGVSGLAVVSGCANILRAVNYPDGGAVTEGRGYSSYSNRYSSYYYNSGGVYGSYSSLSYYSANQRSGNSYYSVNDPGPNRYYASYR